MVSTALSRRLAADWARALDLERRNDLAGALAVYETLLENRPDDADLFCAIARLGERLDTPEVAEKLWARAAALDPGRAEAIDGRARMLSQIGRFDDAIGWLREALLARPDQPPLLTTLGVVLTQAGRAELALTFFDEAVRLDGRSAAAIYNRGAALFDLGRLNEAAADFAAARRLAKRSSDAIMIDLAAATLALARGDLTAGWAAYESRLSTAAAKPVVFEGQGRRWTPATALAGRRLLVLAEQGVGDEIMFAGVLPEVIDDLGPRGRLTVAVDPRLQPLFRRSFPDAEVLGHITVREGDLRRRAAPAAAKPDYWVPMASLPGRYRPTLDSFASRRAYLRPDPARIDHWRAWLSAGPPAVGITWRSGKLMGDRRRHYPPLGDWAPVLATPGVRFVNLQYGDCADEIPAIEGMIGGRLLQAPSLDLRDDLDDVAALCRALDLVVSVGNATGALAGACGASLVMICGVAAWPRLGGDAYPWYPSARALAPPAFGQWDSVMRQVAAMVAETAQEAT